MQKEHGANQKMGAAIRSAEEFVLDKDNNANNFRTKSSDDELVIDRNLKGVDYSLAQCCHPIYGDQIFGFVTVNGGIKIHCQDCPNAPELRKRFGYRIVKARWSGKGTSQYNITLRVVGNDDLGIVNNITNIISKEEKIVMRSINIDSHDGLFIGIEYRAGHILYRGGEGRHSRSSLCDGHLAGNCGSFVIYRDV